MTGRGEKKFCRANRRGDAALDDDDSDHVCFADGELGLSGPGRPKDYPVA